MTEKKKNIGTCPVCGIEIDMDDPEQIKHMFTDDEAHREQLKKAKTDMLFTQMCSTGLMRPVKRD